MLKTVVVHRLKKFRISDHINADCPVNATLDEMSKAGVLAGLDDCFRTIVYDQADMHFVNVGLFLASNGYQPVAEMNCSG